ncbi:ubiquinone biosynthesis accessory factor UbiJ [Uliginosibacterium sp. H1]|uniref:ubiquinone biosynthesis accessory factor UbiJ n=1 Tax=Uliginosibacterium sp. H1 TaxID=3114757 RepID=UPI002E18D4C0|nr:SCP2 sterol-binding domain-containing protein [Uliginosibacterium sp. H1]
MLDRLLLAAANRLLASETWGMQRLAAHAGKAARLELGGLGLGFTVLTDGSLQGIARDAATDLKIELPASALLEVATNPAGLASQAHIEGDAGFAETLSELLAHLRPDLAAQLAPFVGGILAERIGRSTHAAGVQLTDAAGRLARNVSDYLGMESRTVLPASEHLAFAQEVSALRDAVARAEKRIERLASRPQT